MEEVQSLKQANPLARARSRLPDGFAEVSIGQRQVDILRDQFGIVYVGQDARGDNLGEEVA